MEIIRDGIRKRKDNTKGFVRKIQIMTCKHEPLENLDLQELSVNQTVACNDCWKEFKVRLVVSSGLTPKKKLVAKELVNNISVSFRWLD